MALSTTFWIQLLGVIFGLFMLYLSFLKFKRRELKSIEFWVWFVLWVLMLLVALFPYVLDPIIAPLNFYRRLDFFVVLGFFVLLSLGFYNYTLARRLEEKMERIVRKVAFEEHNDGKK